MVPGLDLEHGGVRPFGQLVGGLVGDERGHPDADADAGVGADGVSDRVEASGGLGQVGPTQSAHELIPAVTHDRVERAEPGTDLVDHDLEHTIASGVAVALETNGTVRDARGLASRT